LKDQITAAQEDSKKQSEEKEALKLEKSQIQDNYEKQLGELKSTLTGGND